MKLLDPVWRLIARFRYPMSMPEDVAQALGISLSNSLSFDQFISHITLCLPTRLKKFMPRDEAEEAFCQAANRERFQRNTLCSFDFNEGKIVFVLKFDEKGLLRRIYLHHKNVHSDQGQEIQLSWEPSATHAPRTGYPRAFAAKG